MSDSYQVDIPVAVPPDMAEDILADLEADGRVTIDVLESNAPNIVDQIRWQLDNEQPALEYVDEYEPPSDTDE